MKEETGRWWKKAKQDLDDGRFNLENGRNELAAFLFQQAVEKALKAIQIEEQGKHKLSHDLIALANEAALARFKDLFKDLNPVYTAFRYPDVTVGEIDNLTEIKSRVEEFFKWTEKQLKK